MNRTQIENNLKDLVKNISPDSFIYDLLLAYGTPKTTVTLLKKGNRNLSKAEGQIILKRKLFFQETNEQDLHSLIDVLKKDDATYRHEPRFIVVTDYKTILAVDTKTQDTLDLPIEELYKHPFFFGPWAKIEKNTHYNEQEADVKAAEKMAKIYDEISKENAFETAEDLHGLNIFLSRLLFCFFAEDTGIFKENAFTNAISSHTQDDGSDLDEYLNTLFEVLNTKYHSQYPDYLASFPYVNGGLFGDKYFAPKFTRKARRMIIECGELDWATINPDIFGSMFQAVVHTDQRSSMGQHYTSVPNIMKVIEPLFLNELREEFDKHYDNQKKLEQLLIRLEKLRIFDPACGSGNFLIIAYKEIRELEMEIFQRIQEITTTPSLPFSRIQLSQFYGIELDDFAHEVAILSLWLAEHQMNVKFEEVFGQTNPTLPLKQGGNIVCANATRIPWEDVCPKDKGAEIYILGNPPYLGTRNQEKEHKDDISNLLGHIKNYKTLDYISCWFFKAREYIERTENRAAFVSTNSICQGDQTSILWPLILQNNVEIIFAHQSFKWANNAKKNAGVICVVIGIGFNNGKDKKLYKDGQIKIVKNISPYLVEGGNIIVGRKSSPLHSFPEMIKGSIPADGGHLILDRNSYERYANDQILEPYLYSFIGAQEYIKNVQRWCIYIPNESEYKKIQDHPEITSRMDGVVSMRKSSTKKATQDLAETPYRFAEDRFVNSDCIIVPCTTSERRKYIPVGFLNAGAVIYASAQAIYNPTPETFGFITSLMHMVWVRATAGRLKTDFRYSSSLCYNTFPVPELTGKQKETIISHVYNVLEEREKHSEKTMAELYDPDKMPEGLREAHHHLDLAVERCYRSKPFTSDEERLEYLFKLYEEMTAKEKIHD